MDAVIVAAKRTPVGSFLGSFANTPAHELGASPSRQRSQKPESKPTPSPK